MNESSFKGITKNILNLLEVLFFPSKCHICSAFLLTWNEKIVCENCLSKLRPLKDSICLKCGKVLRSSTSSHLCQDCLINPPPFKVHRSTGEYKGILKDLILLFKYKRKRILGEKLANFAYEVLIKNDVLMDTDIIIPIPLHPIRQKERSFNQSEIVAHELAKLVKKEFYKNVLIKIKNTLPQTQLELKERRKNVKNSFSVNGKDKIKNRKILLIDDVYTSGSTIIEASRVLLKAGAKEVCAFTLARAI